MPKRNTVVVTELSPRMCRHRAYPSRIRGHCLPLNFKVNVHLDARSVVVVPHGGVTPLVLLCAVEQGVPECTCKHVVRVRS